MEILPAIWEKRNLGRSAYEITLSSNDHFEDFLQQEERLQAAGGNYFVVKVPVNRPEFLAKLPTAHYYFVETSFNLSLKRENYSCPSYLQRIDRNLYVKAIETWTDRNRIYQEIAKGIFSSDRIALDPHFSREIANTRYELWIEDMQQQGAKIFEVYSKETAIGFFVVKRLDECRVRGILSGAYLCYQRSGFGALVLKKLCETVWEFGVNWYYAVVVSNNIEALRANLVFGATIESASYTFVKHVKANGEN
jgi:hypothetical protein